jgi:hypothetical protein
MNAEVPPTENTKKRGRPYQTVSLGSIYDKAKTLTAKERARLMEFIKQVIAEREEEKD